VTDELLCVLCGRLPALTRLNLGLPFSALSNVFSPQPRSLQHLWYVDTCLTHQTSSRIPQHETQLSHASPAASAASPNASPAAGAQRRRCREGSCALEQRPVLPSLPDKSSKFGISARSFGAAPLYISGTLIHAQRNPSHIVQNPATRDAALTRIACRVRRLTHGVSGRLRRAAQRVPHPQVRQAHVAEEARDVDVAQAVEGDAARAAGPPRELESGLWVSFVSTTGRGSARAGFGQAV
jgi:hypothetical protein